MDKTEQQQGRKFPRILMEGVLQAGYCDAETPEELEEFDQELREELRQAGCQEVVYDKQATTFQEHGAKCAPRTEPVMLNRWKAQLHDIDLSSEGGQYKWDTIGLRVIIRGNGRIQDIARTILNTDSDPDPDSTGEIELYTFGCRQEGTANFFEENPDVFYSTPMPDRPSTDFAYADEWLKAPDQELHALPKDTIDFVWNNISPELQAILKRKMEGTDWTPPPTPPCQ